MNFEEILRNGLRPTQMIVDPRSWGYLQGLENPCAETPLDSIQVSNLGRFKMNKYTSLLSPGFDRIGDLVTIPQNSLASLYEESSYENLFFNIIVIGAGGTGGYVIRDLSRFIYSIQKRIDNFSYRFVVVDGDKVEDKNLLRQNFLPKDLGKAKAEVIADRHAKAFGLQIEAYETMVNENSLNNILNGYTQSSMYNRRQHKIINIVIGCVDNNEARRQISKYYQRHNQYSSSLFWIDSGNERKGGQVICGGKFMDASMEEYEIPNVVELYPEIKDASQDSTSQVSCAERLMQDEQNIFVNVTAAMHVLNLVRKIILSEDFQIHGVEFDINGKVASRHLAQAA